MSSGMKAGEPAPNATLSWVSDVDRTQVLPQARRGARVLTVAYIIPRIVIPIVFVASVWSVFQGLEMHAYFQRHLYALHFLDRSYSEIKAAKRQLFEYVLGRRSEILESAAKNAVLAHADFAEVKKRLDKGQALDWVLEGEAAFSNSVEKQLKQAQADVDKRGETVARRNLKAALLASPDSVSAPLVNAHFQTVGEMVLSGEKFKATLRETNLIPAVIGLLTTFLAVLFWLTRAYVKQRRLNEKALQASQAQIKFLIDNIHDGLVIVDADGVIEGTNSSLLDMLHAGEEADLVGKPVSRILGSDIDVVLDSLEDSPLTLVQERQATRFDGEAFPAEVTIKEVRTLDGASRVISMRDLTEKKALERWKQEMVAIVSHDLRTPLTSMRGALGLIATGALGAVPSGVQEKLNAAQDNVLKMIKLINDLLDLEKLEASAAPPKVVAVDLKAVLERACISLDTFAAQRQVCVFVKPTTLEVEGDDDLLVKMFTHLLENGIKFSSPGASVNVTIGASGPWVEVRVSDQGRGIPAAHIDSVFQRMQQVESGDRAQGNGLGLPLCKAIAHLHGGVIGLESDAAGTTVWVLLKPVTIVSRPVSELEAVPQTI